MLSFRCRGITFRDHPTDASKRICLEPSAITGQPCNTEYNAASKINRCWPCYQRALNERDQCERAGGGGGARRKRGAAGGADAADDDEEEEEEEEEEGDELRPASEKRRSNKKPRRATGMKEEMGSPSANEPKAKVPKAKEPNAKGRKAKEPACPCAPAPLAPRLLPSRPALLPSRPALLPPRPALLPPLRGFRCCRCAAADACKRRVCFRCPLLLRCCL